MLQHLRYHFAILVKITCCLTRAHPINKTGTPHTTINIHRIHLPPSELFEEHNLADFYSATITLCDCFWGPILHRALHSAFALSGSPDIHGNTRQWCSRSWKIFHHPYGDARSRRATSVEPIWRSRDTSLCRRTDNFRIHKRLL